MHYRIVIYNIYIYIIKDIILDNFWDIRQERFLLLHKIFIYIFMTEREICGMWK